MGSNTPRIKPHLMAILAKRFDFIVQRMNDNVLRSARSAVINTAKDFSCSLTDGEGRIVCSADALPSHMFSSELVSKAMLELFDDIHPGDCFLNNSPYYGNTHHADYTLLVPVFFERRHLFTTVIKAHQADCGNSQPTTYMPFPRDLYEEGAIDWPCVRVQRDYKDIEDVIRMGRMRIRVPDQWYGDYLSQLGACRIGEQEVIRVCEKYGVDTVQAFLEEWQEYGKRSMIAAIQKLPAGTWENDSVHDPVPFVAPEGIRVRVKMTIDPDEGFISLDFTGSDDWVPGGLNMSEANTRAAGFTGVMNNLVADIPKNDGAVSRIKIITREGSVVGSVKHPVCASMCTTNVADRVIVAVQSTFAKVGAEMGMAEGAVGMPASAAVISGTDWRRGGAPYVNQLIIGGAGGPALYGHDGSLAYGIPGAAGMVHMDSVEIDELKFPILFERNEMIEDSGGAGRWCGAPGVECRMRPRHDPGQWIYSCDCLLHPPRGVAGGQDGSRTSVWKWYRKGDNVQEIELPGMNMETFTPEELLVSKSSGGGGFGDRLERDPELVRKDAREGFISVEGAREVYGVVLDAESEHYTVDYEATKKLRNSMK